MKAEEMYAARDADPTISVPALAKKLGVNVKTLRAVLTKRKRGELSERTKIVWKLRAERKSALQIAQELNLTLDQVRYVLYDFKDSPYYNGDKPGTNAPLDKCTFAAAKPEAHSLRVTPATRYRCAHGLEDNHTVCMAWAVPGQAYCARHARERRLKNV